MIGVDTPERGEECFEEAAAYLEQRVGGQTVRYRYQQERTDRYDRALLDIFGGGQLVNLDIVQAGCGEELTIAPNGEAERRGEMRRLKGSGRGADLNKAHHVHHVAYLATLTLVHLLAIVDRRP